MVLKGRRDFSHLSACPYFQESPVQYCAAAQFVKYLPYTEIVLPPCGNDNHRYCESYLEPAHPEQGVAESRAEEGDRQVHGIRVPARLAFSPNHMWLDIGEGGSCHVGVDAFFAKVLGSFDGLSFVTTAGISSPRAAFTLRGIDLHMVFPGRIHITRVNTYLRIHPGKVISDPYGMGWLFEGVVPDTVALEHLRAGLFRGEEAGEWMEREQGRICKFLHDRSPRPSPQAGDAGAGWGTSYRGLMNQLSREELLRLFNEFFTPHATRIH
jgi:glycine cleavage system H lipoate-binding protein